VLGEDGWAVDVVSTPVLGEVGWAVIDVSELGAVGCAAVVVSYFVLGLAAVVS
jgi:hypothetical protein